jgi:hypothetical protein
MGKKNFRTKVEKVFFFIFISFYAEMSFKNKKTQNRVNFFYLNRSIWGSVQKIRNFTLISKWGFLSLYLAPYLAQRPDF